MREREREKKPHARAANKCARAFFWGAGAGAFFYNKGDSCTSINKISDLIKLENTTREREREAHTHAHTRERSVFEALSLFPFSKIVRFVCLFDAIG